MPLIMPHRYIITPPKNRALTFIKITPIIIPLETLFTVSIAYLLSSDNNLGMVLQRNPI